MAGISSKAAGKGLDCGCGNKKGYNGNEIQAKEFSDGSGLDVYDFNARTYDQQIGRFIQIDPLAEEGGQESLSPFHFANNNPILYNDPDGKCFFCPAIPAIIEGVQVLAAAVVAYVATKEAAPVVKNAIQNAEAPYIPASSHKSVTNNSFAWDPTYIDQWRRSRMQPVAPSNPKVLQVTKKGPKDLAADGKAAIEKAAAEKARAAQRAQQTKEGKVKVGTSNQGTRGSHDSGGRDKEAHDAAEARRAREQKAADAKKEAAKKGT